MTVDYYMNYSVYFTDQTEFNAAVATYGRAITTPPRNAGVVFGIPYPYPSGPPGDKGIYFYFPYTPGLEIGFPLPSGVFIDDTLPQMFVPGQTDPFGNVFPDGNFIWIGLLTLQGGGATPAAVPLPQRRWAIGFEMPTGGETNGSPLINVAARSASRTPDGMGFCYRSITNSYSVSMSTFGAGGNTPVTWERIYFRIRRLPSASQPFWQCHGSPSDSAGARLNITAAGAIEVFNCPNFSGPVSIGTTTALNLLVWYRCDIVTSYNTAVIGGAGGITVRLNGASVFSAAVPDTAGGLGQNSSTHVRSTIGNEPGTNFGLELDLDDWICCDGAGGYAFNSVDFLTGSHVQLLRPTGFAASHNAAWVGDYRVALQNPAIGATGRITCSTAGARLAVTVTPTTEDVTTQFGAASMVVGLYSSRAANDGTLGFKLAGATTLSAIVQSAGLAFNSVLYRPTGLTPAAPPHSPNLPTIFPVELYHEKGSGAGASAVALLMAAAEFIGCWGVEDGDLNDPAFPPVLPSLDIHNAPYLRYQLNGAATSPMGAVVVQGLTYVGNGTGQSIPLAAPPHWYWIRRVTAVAGASSHWHSSGLTFGYLNTQRTVADGAVWMHMDAGGNVTLNVSGADADINANGVTYQVVYISDPGMRFLLAGAFTHSDTLASAVTTLLDTTFAPVGMFLQIEQMIAGSNTINYWYKGPGYAAATAQRMTGAEIANALTLAVGQFTTQTPLHVNEGKDGEVSYVAMRLADGSGDLGVVLQLFSYTGNGVNPRTIPCTPASNRFPMFVMVLGHNGAVGMVFRDPSHTGTDSSQGDGTIITTGIVGSVAVDTFIVQNSLNSVGVIYDVFVIPGCALVAFCNTTLIPVAPVVIPHFPLPGPPVAPNPGCVVTFPLGDDSEGGVGCQVSL